MRFAALILPLTGLVAATPTLPETPDTFKSSTTTNQASMSMMKACDDGESPMNGNMCLPKLTGTFWYDLPGNRTRFDADPPDMSGGMMGSSGSGMMGALMGDSSSTGSAATSGGDVVQWLQLTEKAIGDGHAAARLSAKVRRDVPPWG